jgi:membrane associated rhomboid family serine protease
MVLPLRDENPTVRPAVLTILLIVANVVVFVFLQPSSFKLPNMADPSQLNAEVFLYEHAAVPCEITHGHALSPALIHECEGSTLVQAGNARPAFPHKNVYLAAIVSMFLHASWFHLLGNMLFLWIFGNNVEDRFTSVGYLLFYVVAGIAATAAHVLTQPNSITPVLGASGAIAGVMGAYIVMFPRARILTIVPLFFFFFMRLPAWVVLGGWFLLQFATNPNSGVAAAAHIGGFAFGVAVAWVARPFITPRHELPRY